MNIAVFKKLFSNESLIEEWSDYKLNFNLQIKIFDLQTVVHNPEEKRFDLNLKSKQYFLLYYK